MPPTRLGQPWNPHTGSRDVVLVLAHFEEDLTWLHTRQPYDFYVVSKCCHELADTHPQLVANIGTEASAYFKFMSDFYDVLPDRMFCMHAHEESVHQSVSATSDNALAVQCLPPSQSRQACQ